MAIMVHYKDNTVSFVPDEDLVELMLSGSIVAFRRGTEWISLAGTNASGSYAMQMRKSARERSHDPSKGRVWKRVILAEAG